MDGEFSTASSRIKFGVTNLGRVFFTIVDSAGMPTRAIIDRDNWSRMQTSINKMLSQHEEEKNDR